jgi:hypothetical protein
MVASVVQVAPKGFGGGGGGVPFVSFTFGTTPTIGNAIIVPAEVGGGTIVSVTDNQATGGNTYTRKINASQSGGPWDAEIWECPNVTKASGTFTVTVTFSTNAWGAAAGVEVSGLDTAGTLDQMGTSNTGTGDTTPGVVASDANEAADSFAVALFSSASSSPSNAITGPTGYTQIFEHEDGNAANSGAAGYKILSALETSSAAWTQGDNVGYAAVIATFKVAAGGGPTAYMQSVSGTLTPAGALNKKAKKLASGTLTTAGVASKKTAKSMSGTLTTSGAIVKKTAHLLAGTLTTAGALIKFTHTSMSGGLAFAGALTNNVGLSQSLDGTLSFSSSISKKISKGLSGLIGITGDITKKTGKYLVGTLTTAGTLGIGFIYRQALTGVLSFAGALVTATGVVVSFFSNIYHTISNPIKRFIKRDITEIDED